MLVTAGHKVVTGQCQILNQNKKFVATTQSKHVLLLAGHSWSQDGHTSNLMPDPESAHHFDIVTCATLQYQNDALIPDPVSYTHLTLPTTPYV